MKLEFELDKGEVDEELVLFPVKRKGLQVGTLALDKEPYEQVKDNLHEATLK